MYDPVQAISRPTFLTSNFFLLSPAASAVPGFPAFDRTLDLAGPVASCISTSAMVNTVCVNACDYE